MNNGHLEFSTDQRTDYELRLKIRLGLERVEQKLIGKVRDEGIELVCGDGQGNIIRVRADNLAKILTLPTKSL